MKNEFNINIYSNLTENNSQINVNAYKSPDTFKYNSENIEEIEFLKKIIVREYEILRDLNETNVEFESRINGFFIKKIINSDKMTIVLITDYQIKPPSRLRSYKGILDKELKRGAKYIEEEVFITDTYTIIGSLVIVDNQNIENILDNYFGDSSTCCIFCFENTINFNKEFLIEILKNYMVHTQTSTINYFSLCKLLKQNEKIIRIGGDGYDEVSLQIFSLK